MVHGSSKLILTLLPTAFCTSLTVFFLSKRSLQMLTASLRKQLSKPPAALNLRRTVTNYIKFHELMSLTYQLQSMVVVCYCAFQIGFYRAMRCKRGLCCHAVSVCPSVRPSRSRITSKQIHISSKFFHHRVATPF